MIRLTDRITYTATYRLALPFAGALARVLPTRFVRTLAFRADRREAAASYTDGDRRVGFLRRLAIDRYDARADASVVYYRELQIRAGRWPRAYQGS